MAAEKYTHRHTIHTDTKIDTIHIHIYIYIDNIQYTQIHTPRHTIHIHRYTHIHTIHIHT